MTNSIEKTAAHNPLSARVSISHEHSDPAREKADLFTATAAHDLKGHLQLIAGGLALLRRNYAGLMDAQGDQTLLAMNRAVVRMKELIADILTLSKAKEEHHRLELVDLSEVAHSVLTDLQSSMERLNAKVSIEQLPVVCGDKFQLYQVFQNLLNNSLKYRKPDVAPQINIRCRLVPCDKSNSTDLYHEISIQDNGIGFTDQQARTLFESFHRLNNPGIEGSGLGLSICQRIITGHKGSIRAEGQPGVGATFSFQLPSIRYCDKRDDCPFAATSYDRKCPAIAPRSP